jgi:hypothetical protein
MHSKPSIAPFGSNYISSPLLHTVNHPVHWFYVYFVLGLLDLFSELIQAGRPSVHASQLEFDLIPEVLCCI